MILRFLRWRQGAYTAWEIAKHINALGSSVSSTMFKMRQRGELVEDPMLTKHGGRRYRAA
jgi:hypothetical protein